MTHQAKAARLVQLLNSSAEDVRSMYAEVGDMDVILNQIREDWEYACIVIVGGRANRHALCLASVCTCLECVLYTECEHTCFVEALDLPIRPKVRNFELFRA
jgi:hypothetical protein